MSLSAPGEDLGKLYGVALSEGHIPEMAYLSYQQLLLEHHTKGLRLEGWRGDENIIKYGFSISVALRSIWEVPKLLEILAQSKSRGEFHQKMSTEKVRRLLNITQLQMKLAEEANHFMTTVSICRNGN